MYPKMSQYIPVKGDEEEQPDNNYLPIRRKSLSQGWAIASRTYSIILHVSVVLLLLLLARTYHEQKKLKTRILPSELRQHAQHHSLEFAANATQHSLRLQSSMRK